MSQRDDFVNLSYRLLQNDDMTNSEQQLWLEYLLRYLRGNKIVINSLPDVYDWTFSGDNIIFNQLGLTIPIDQIFTNYFVDFTLTGSGSLYIDAVYVDGNYVYVGGRFEGIGGTSSNNIARLNLSSLEWEALSGIDTPGASDLVADITKDSNGVVYLGGVFDISSTTYYFAKLVGTTVTAISGPGNKVTTLYPDGSGNVYLGGSFATCGVAGTSKVALYDGSVFSDLDSGLVGTIYGLDGDSSGNVYAVGLITQIVNGSVDVTNAVVWDGAKWSEVGGGLGSDTNYLSCVEIDDNDNVYVGGFYSPYMWKLSGSSWASIGGGINDSVLAITSDSDGNLYFVGAFTGPGLRLAKYSPDTGTMYSMGSSFTTQQNDIDITSDGVIIVGGIQ